MRILGFDTSAKAASVALSENGKLISEFYLDSGFTHSETVLPMAKAVLDAARITPAEIDLFAVNCGPGSFTGLRIGIAAVKALGMSLEKPCAAVSTLEALAHNMQSSEGIICAAMDARCSQVYTAFFESDGTNLTRLCDDRAISTDELFEDIKKIVAEKGGKVWLVGDGAALCQKKFGGEFVKTAPSQLVLGHASGTCAAAQKLFEKGETVSAGELVPNYLRLAQAEREKLQKEGKL
ncbi:MAG: tRNA (adenosine(37)-N6)-threonylcarbamoyltransferase complex dimerization subunit type 1 TsaB [Oscillospiraceae bacterium]|nr:tRNA (adenosine(37)-N6)-threonylcarbamoyltransferase complex dimerization subunit type 1 TsaB [Oscillospiraceae bacterium]